MRAAFIPTRACVWGVAALALACALAALAGVPPQGVAIAAATATALGLLLAVFDIVRTRRLLAQHPLVWSRELPAAFALGVKRTVHASVSNRSERAWKLTAYDDVPSDVDTEGLPIALNVPAASQAGLQYVLTPHRRGALTLGAAHLRVRTRWGFAELRVRSGAQEVRHVYPNFAAVARYAWLAGDRRLAEIGIKTYVQRGAGTDFKQLADYRPGDAIRDIDWKATVRHHRPIVRQYQDERDQRVVFLLDCGRRMRADEEGARHGSHFDEALNAMMLLAHVALKDGDEVGVITFGNPPGEVKQLAPRKGVNSLNGLVAALHDIEPRAVHSDYLQAATDLMRQHRKRALVVVLTNFRDEDTDELTPALKLMRSRHLVLLASLRERVLTEMAAQPLKVERDAVDVAGAHWFEQARTTAFRRLADTDALLLDVEPARLAAELVNRYRAVKKAGLL